ncbi:MAG: DNA-binding winged helix-turn-helix (wHTH) protein [Shewanella sp.]|jgi:DNA-binding winged helix-turn-helix (wHTH) protein
MQIGDSWFDPARGELVNQKKMDSWHLPRAELQVLVLLLEHRGKLVSKKLLRAGSDEHPALSDSSIARAVFMLRSHLGPQHEYLIETVKGQGYLLLCDKPRDIGQADTETQLLTRLKPVLLLAAGGLAVLVVALVLHLSWTGSTQAPTSAYRTETVALSSGQQVTLSLFSASNTNNHQLLQLADEVATSLRLCDASLWTQVSLSLSHDNQIFNMTLRGESMGQSVVRNLKISDSRLVKGFVTSRWLQAVDICG